MMALSPQLCNLGWLLEDPIISHEQENLNYFCRERTETSDSINDLHSPSSVKIQSSMNGEFAGLHEGGENKIVKKLNHNASERDRRKRINTLYSTLRSLLPHEDYSKKLSIPATVSRVLKYIPELQKEVERLIQKKESLMMTSSTRVSSVGDNASSFGNKKQRIKSTHDETCSFSATKISDREIVIQSSMPKAEKRYAFSEALMSLEEEGFVVMNATSSESFEGRVFYNLHLQAQGNQVVDAEMLKEKVWPFY